MPMKILTAHLDLTRHMVKMISIRLSISFLIQGFRFPSVIMTILYKPIFKHPKNTGNPKFVRLSGMAKPIASSLKKAGGDYAIVMADEDGQDLIRFDAGEIFSRYQAYDAEKYEMSVEEATFLTESERVALTLVVQSVTVDFAAAEKYEYAQLYILVRFK